MGVARQCPKSRLIATKEYKKDVILNGGPSDNV